MATSKSTEPKSAAEKAETEDVTPGESPYPEYDFMSLDELRELAKERGVTINADVEKAHLVTELRAADSRGV